MLRNRIRRLAELASETLTFHAKGDHNHAIQEKLRKELAGY